MDVSAIERDRDQLWAEAVHWYNEGHPWHLDEDALQAIAKAEQDKRFKPSPWLECVETESACGSTRSRRRTRCAPTPQTQNLRVAGADYPAKTALPHWHTRCS